MKLHSVGYDLRRPDQHKPRVVRRLEQLGAKPFTFPVWVLRSEANMWELRNDLLSYLDEDDRLLIADVTHAPVTWNNIDIRKRFGIGLR